ncbi:MAG: endonuclease, partial [Saprospiraceae bacterium]|nr:endonuclease [Saprospiraceae bacterium]
MRLLLILSFFCFGTSSMFGQNPVFPSLEGTELFNAVVGAFKTTTTLGNSVSRDVLFGEIYHLPGDSVRCIYTGYTVYVDPSLDPSQAAFAEGLNTEHTYPKSMGAEGGLAESDLHHLHPSREDVNADRASLPFGEVPDAQADNWYFMDQEAFSPPANNIDLYSERLINQYFEPREDHKGNVARAVFYFYTIYRNEANAANPDFFESQRADLCEWHALDPVDPDEWERTYLIAAYQDDKPNPFILDCTLAARMYCPGLEVECGTNLSAEETSLQELSGRIDLFPNPSQGQLNIQLELLYPVELQVRLLDLQGRVIKELIRTDLQAGNWSDTLDTGDLPNGWYGVQIRLYGKDGLAQ